MRVVDDLAVPAIGAPAERIDGGPKATGAHVYPSDFHVDGMLTLRLLRSAHANARVLDIDIAEAAAADGVVGVYTATDVPGKNDMGVLREDCPALVEDRVRSTADILAVIVAGSDEQARAARDLISVRYEPLPRVTDARDALKVDAPLVHDAGNVLAEIHHSAGDVEAAFAGAACVVEGDFRTGRQEHLPMETEAGVAYYDDDGVLTVRHGGQYPRDATQIAQFLGLPPEKVRVLTPMMGGSFGGKDDFTIQCHLALATYMTQQPCSVMLDRSESIATTPKRHPYDIKAKIACDEDGKLQAAAIELISDTGAYASWGESVLHVSTETCLGSYYFPNVQLDAYCVYTNNCVSGAFRGFGALQATVGIECLLDEMARELDIDPIEFRRTNALEPGQTGPSGIDFNSVDSSLGLVLDEIRTCDLYRNRDELTRLSAQEGPWKARGVGVAAAWMGVGYGQGIPDSSEAAVELTETGTYVVHVGGADMGQGNATAFAQLVAAEMNCDMDRVEVDMGDSAGPDSGACDAVRTMYLTATAVTRAVTDLSDQMREAVGERLGCPSDAVELIDDVGRHVGTNDAVSLGSLGGRTGSGVIRIHQEDEHDNTDDHNRWVFTYAAQVALVEVDLLTGRIDVLRIVSAVDAGKVINLQGFEAQSEGGIAQSIGFTLTEDCITEDGHILNAGLSTYIVPYISDIPDSIETIAVESPDPQTPFGAKGIAEIVMLPTPPAIMNAVFDATGERFTDLPLTPEKVLARITDAD